MEFLHWKEIVHRDLALRNILLTSDYIVKIGDFGLSRRTISGSYQKCHSPLLPLKWTAPEVFVDNNVPIESDLYTFGILLWELFTLGGTPHEQFIFIQEVEEEEINVVAKKGKRMDKPPFAPKEIYELMKLLCNLNPYLRPPLKQCKRNIFMNLKESCPPLASRIEVADSLKEPDRNTSSHQATANKVPIEMLTNRDAAKSVNFSSPKITSTQTPNNENTSRNGNDLLSSEASPLILSVKMLSGVITANNENTSRNGNEIESIELSPLIASKKISSQAQPANNENISNIGTEPILSDESSLMPAMTISHKKDTLLPQPPASDDNDNEVASRLEVTDAFEELDRNVPNHEALAIKLASRIEAVGHGEPQSDEETAKWFRKAAEQGNAAAQYNLGGEECLNHMRKLSNGTEKQQNKEMQMHNSTWAICIVMGEEYLNQMRKLSNGIQKPLNKEMQ
uniref:Protein kinase domain-containing protein n=1 Tax=Plectus sambesii TaxID=2011161 RepID=A0A914XFF0_9BILA